MQLWWLFPLTPPLDITDWKTNTLTVLAASVAKKRSRLSDGVGFPAALWFWRIKSKTTTLAEWPSWLQFILDSRCGFQVKPSVVQEILWITSRRKTGGHIKNTKSKDFVCQKALCQGCKVWFIVFWGLLEFGKRNKNLWIYNILLSDLFQWNGALVEECWVFLGGDWKNNHVPKQLKDSSQG